MAEYKLIATLFNKKRKDTRKELGTFATFKEAKQELDDNLERWKKEMKRLYAIYIQCWVDGKPEENYIGYEVDLYE